MFVRRTFAVAAVLAAAQGASASDWLQRFEAECRRSGGTPVHNPGGGGYCRPAGGSAGGGGGNPYMPGVEQFLGSLWAWEAQNETASKQRRAAIAQAIEGERQNALARQDMAYANSLAAIQQRMAAAGLQLKLGAEAKPAEYGLPGRHVFRNDIFTGGNVDETEKIALALKLGPAATASLRGDTPRPPAAAAAPEQQAEIDKIAQIFTQLPPERQQRLLAALKQSVDATAAPVPQAPTAIETRPEAPGVVAGSPTRGTPADPPLSPKLAEARKAADELRSAAEGQGGSLESLKAGAHLEVASPTTVTLGNPAPLAQHKPAAPTANGTPRPGRAPAPAVAPSTTAAKPGGHLAAAPSSTAPPSAAAGKVPGVAESDLHLLFPPKALPASAIPAKHALVALFAPDLVKRYETEPAVAARVNEMIDLLAAEERRWRAEADEAARNASLEATTTLMRRFTPEGQQPDVKTLLRIPAFVEARDAIAQKVEDARLANAEEARRKFRVQLESAFQAVRLTRP